MSFVFPQTITGDQNFNRTGGLTKRELASMIFAAHEVAMCDLFHAGGKLTDEAARELRGHAMSHAIKCADALLLMLEMK